MTRVKGWIHRLYASKTERKGFRYVEEIPADSEQSIMMPGDVFTAKHKCRVIVFKEY